MTLAFTTGALAQADAPAKSTSAVKTAHTVNDGKAEAGRNSFTQAQAREHIAKSRLCRRFAAYQGNDGIWRGTAQKNGGP